MNVTSPPSQISYFRSLAVTAMLLLGICVPLYAQPTSRPQAMVRVAAIGNVNDQGFWSALCQRFEKESGIKVDTTGTRSKDSAPAVFKEGGIDVITMQSPDAVTRLVADGYALDVRPWAQLDLAIVGPAEDPAKIKGMADATAAVKKIIASKSPFLIHASLGADQVVREIVQSDRGQLKPGDGTIVLNDHQKQVLTQAMEMHAYTLIARVPFVGGKFDHPGYELMVQGDPILRRSLVAAVADERKIAGVRTSEGRRFMRFLTSPQTQEWIADYESKEVVDGSVAFPVAHPLAATRPSHGVLRLFGEIPRSMDFTKDEWSNLKHHKVSAKDYSGKEAEYEGVYVADLLRMAGAPLGGHQMRGDNLSLYLTIEAADGYKAVFAMADFESDFADRQILLADKRDGESLPAKEGPLHLIVPTEALPARWVRQVIAIQVKRD